MKIPYKAVLLILMVCIVAGTIQKASSEELPANEYEVKAAFLHNILGFVQWPKDSQGTPDNRVNLCILGNGPFGNAVRNMEGETIGDNKTIALRYTKSLKGLNNCHILLIAPSEEDRIAQIVASLRGAHVLTLGDTEGFAQKGVIINFYIEGAKVRFEINANAAHRAGLKISSRLLKLARVIDS
ncbi:MAG: YfiR family protein [Thermodesulfovibrionales bacterium]